MVTQILQNVLLGWFFKYSNDSGQKLIFDQRFNICIFLQNNKLFNGLISALNKRTFTIRRVANQIPKEKLIKVVQSLWMSKLRYGLQLCNKVRINEEEMSNQNMKSTQIAMNKMVRMVEGASLKEVKTWTLLL